MFGWLKPMRCKHNYCKHWKRSHGLCGGYVTDVQNAERKLIDEEIHWNKIS
uniref:Uncharacterized protein n=1 Tax=Siphoviridae sp. ctxfQ4 TaxID=2826521 RepID=A0A8S5N6G5_9CAUD|nr:MAG TPA: hypothetical protein [Siphoviridae sp. ctxfQ4]